LHWTLKTGPKPLIPGWVKKALSSSIVALGGFLQGHRAAR
jgi:hypothetical protein